ncbi:MAG: type IV secretion system DNA-binding domain-containing protein [Nitrospirota bacterium]
MYYFKIERPHYENKQKHETLTKPESTEHPLILVQKEKDAEYFKAIFALELAGVIRKDNYPKPNDKLEEREDGQKAGIYNLLLSGVTSNQRIDFIYKSVKSDKKDNVFNLKIKFSSNEKTSEKAITSAQKLWQNLSVILEAISNEYCFVPVREAGKLTGDEISDYYIANVRPLGIVVNTDIHKPIGFKRSESIPASSSVLVAPYNEINKIPAFDSVIIGSAGCPADVRVLISLKPFAISKSEIEMIASALKWLKNGEKKEISYHQFTDEGIEDEKVINGLQTALNNLLRNPSGFRIICTAMSEKPIPTSFLSMIGKELFNNNPICISMKNYTDNENMMPCSKSDIDDQIILDLRDYVHSATMLPPFLPGTETLIRYGTKRIFKQTGLKISNDGILLGMVNVGRTIKEVRFSRHDRSRHCYILGATGTGKSTLLYNMIRQDINNGEGICVIDPHGDLYQQVLESIPPGRIDDVVLVDPCDFENAVGINFLECKGSFKSSQINFIVNEMIKIFDRLYDLRQTGGPIFEQYMRNAMLLCMNNDMDATLMDVIMVFEDREYRQFLKSKCKSPIVVNFWNKQAEEAGGDASLQNLAPYITSKLNQFTTNALLRPIIGQRKSTIDFRKVIDERKILLVNLSKGFLGELDTQLLGMLIIGKIFSSAMGRIALRPEVRHPFFLYIDEFQNFTTNTVAHLLSEARKFGIYLTLANQNLSQLSTGSGKQNILDAVLGNVGTILIFRLGAVDAEKMQIYTKPVLCDQDLQDIPDYHVAGRLLVKNSPSRPFVFETLPSQGMTDNRNIDAIIKASQKKYTTPVSKVEEEILAWRTDYKHIASGEQESKEIISEEIEKVLSEIGI